MRRISPIIDSSELDENIQTNVLVANFHTALDVKYVISENILWSVFIHTLKELSEGQLVDAVKQMYLANVNFGTSYSSTSLVFPGSIENDEKEVKPNEVPLKKRIYRI
jgi:hypothetical protein